MTMSCEVNSMKQPIYTEFNLDAKVGISQMIAITHTDDRNADVLEVNVRQNGAHIDLTGATVFARMVLHKDRDYLLSDSVPCTVSDSGNVLIPFDNAVIPVQKGNIKIEVNLTQADSVLTLQFPLWVSVNGSILDDAELTPESRGTVPDLLREAAAQLSRVKDFATEDFVFENLDAALQGNPHTAPSLFVMQDAETDNYKLVYMDSNDNLHVLFDFGLLPVAKGEKGDKGDDYVLTEQDKADIAGMVDISGKADKATTLAGYGITDAYTKTQTDTFFSDTNADIADLKAYIGYTDGDILGLHADFENKVFTRLGAAVGLTAGQDFNAFTMYGGRRRCCVSNDGTINAYYGEQDYVEDGSNGQVMVYQPKFYYCMVPLKLEKQASGLGYHIRKANYYVTANPHPGFKLHPLFYDANGNEVDYVLLSAYEGSMYDVSESAYVNDGVDSISYASGDLLCSVSGKKPISGKLTPIGSRKNFEDMAQTRGTSWHLDTIQSVSANQLLMMIELGTLNVQSAVGRGVVTASDNNNYNCASLTGATASLGNATGMASTTIGESAGTETTETTNGKLSVSYRGVENPWGNIWKYINGINLWGNGSMNGGQAYICSDFTFSDSDRTQHYQPSGFTVSNSNGYASAFGYGDEAYDWLMIPSECTGSSIEPVGDQSYFKPNLNEFNIARLGGSWNSNTNGGAYCWGFVYTPGFRYYFLGGRLLYVPTATGFGPQGPAGSNYALTAADRQAIAQIAMNGLNGNGVAY